MTIASNLLALLGPLLSGYAVDAVEPGVGKVDFQRVFFYAGWMAGVLYFIGSFVLWAFGADGNGQPEGGKENEGRICLTGFCLCR